MEIGRAAWGKAVRGGLALGLEEEERGESVDRVLGLNAEI